MYRRLANGPASQPGRENMPELFDSFELHGPNGAHQCLVMELLGQPMASLAESFATNRLPGHIAWKVIKRIVQATAYVHRMGVIHGGEICAIQVFLPSKLLSLCSLDLHPGNIVLVDQAVSKQSADDILRSMCAPVTAQVQVTHGRGATSHSPQYLVLPSTLPLSPELSNNCRIKIIDFGSAFLSGDPSPKMRCPLPYRAPEAVITGSWDVEADIWSLVVRFVSNLIKCSLHNQFAPRYSH